jgi:hypothetical protein
LPAFFLGQVGKFRQPGLAGHGQGQQFGIVVDALDKQDGMRGQALPQRLPPFAGDVGGVEDGDLAFGREVGLGLGDADGGDAFAQGRRVAIVRIVEAGMGGVAGDHAPAHVAVVEDADLDVVFFEVFLDLGRDSGLAHGRQPHHGDAELGRPCHYSNPISQLKWLVRSRRFTSLGSGSRRSTKTQ